MEKQYKQIIIYNTPDGNTKLEVNFMKILFGYHKNNL